MSVLAEHLARLDGWLRQDGTAPLWAEFRLVESKDIRYGKVDEIPRSAIKSQEEYEEHFRTLVSAGYAWINLSALGVLDGHLLVSVELPRDVAGCLQGRTSINLSGPPLDAGRPLWDVSKRTRLLE